jgi:hypothetical protein
LEEPRILEVKNIKNTGFLKMTWILANQEPLGRRLFLSVHVLLERYQSEVAFDGSHTALRVEAS